jgi:hypothetical protein
MRYILKILGIGAELAEKSPFTFYLAQVFLAFVPFASLFYQAVLMEYSSYGLVAAGQMVFAFEPLGAFERIVSALSIFF